MRPQLVLTAALLAGCGPGNIGYTGYDVPDHFPLDGSTLFWEYRSDDGEGRLTVEKSGSTVQDGLEVVTLTHSLDDSWVADVRWASDPVDGVLLLGYSHDEDEVDFEPPVVLSERHAVPDDVVVTQSGGRTWTAGFERIEGCATFWVPQWADESCLVFTLDDGDDDPGTHGIVTGTYHLVPQYGAAWLDLDAYDLQWRLYDHDWEE